MNGYSWKIVGLSAKLVMRSVERFDPAQDGAFGYLLREPRHARRWQRWSWITASIVVFVALASLAWAIGVRT